MPLKLTAVTTWTPPEREATPLRRFPERPPKNGRTTVYGLDNTQHAAPVVCAYGTWRPQRHICALETRTTPSTHPQTHRNTNTKMKHAKSVTSKQVREASACAASVLQRAVWQGWRVAVGRHEGVSHALRSHQHLNTHPTPTQPPVGATHTHTLKAHKHSSTSHTPPSTQAPQLNITMSTMAALGCPGAVGSSWPSSPAAAVAAPRTVVAAPLLQGAGGVAQTKPADGRQACSTHGPGRS